MVKESINKIKIVFLLNDMDVGGVQKSMISLLDYLIGQKYFEIDVVVWEGGGLLEHQIPQNVNIVYQEHPPLLKDISDIKNIRSIGKNLIKFLRFKYLSTFKNTPWKYFKPLGRHYDFAISYVHRGYPLYYTIDKVSADHKFLWFHHGVYEPTNEERKLDNIYFQKYKTIVPVSESNKAELTNNFDFDANKLKVISNLINIEEILLKSQEAIVDLPKSIIGYNFVTVSRISSEKGIDLAIDIAHKLKIRGLNFKWYFVGDGPIINQMLDKVKDLELIDFCVFLGAKYNPYPYMRMADLYIQPSYVEAHPITINEALVLKKLIVATNITSINHVLQDGYLGLVSERDADQFADNIENLLHNDDIRNTIIENVKKHSVSNDITCQKINDLFSL